MKPRKSTMLVLLAAMAATGLACKKSAETERNEANKAADEAERVTVDENRKAAEKSNKKSLEAMDEHNDFLAAVRREQLDLRGTVQEEIDAIDRKLSDYKVEHGRDGQFVIPNDAKEREKIDSLIKRRAVLITDADAIESCDPEEWHVVKAKVDADLGKPVGKGRI